MPPTKTQQYLDCRSQHDPTEISDLCNQRVNPVNGNPVPGHSLSQINLTMAGGSALSYHHREGDPPFNSRPGGNSMMKFYHFQAILGLQLRHPVFKIYRKQTESLRAPLMVSWQGFQEGGKGSQSLDASHSYLSTSRLHLKRSVMFCTWWYEHTHTQVRTHARTNACTHTHTHTRARARTYATIYF